MLLKNDPFPKPITAKVVHTDGSPIATGVIAFHVTGATRTAVAGTAAAAIGTSGLWTYTPTQAETNYDEYGIEFYHANAIGQGPFVQVFTDTKLNSDLSAEIAPKAVEATLDTKASQASVNALNDLSASEVKAQVDQSVKADLIIQPGKTDPPKDASIATMAAWNHKFLINQKNSDGTTRQIFNDDGVTVDQQAAVNQVGGTVTVGKFTAAP